jgi:hypothetical protein
LEELDSPVSIDNSRNSSKYDKSLDKSISILRIAMSRLSDLILDMDEDDDFNWLLHEELMCHRHLLHRQVDQLIKIKQKKLKMYG